ncbi:hypothetical protein D9757_006063 [Collybiopsis confluens]|uniref:Uncharacterized protein n=1 Tax=Collybiopsis confluens TaxID=2823264 RepID=A0A8H5HUK6_9AGAR|nr:hypothetical protein D9757_006063 [Collybiopsis confluens]
MPNWSRCLRQRRSKFMMTLCANGLSCFAHPLLNSNVTSLSCDTQADALARIQTLGVDGGFDGNGAGLNDTSSTAATSSMMATSTVASSSSSATGTASANSATMMAIWIVRMTIVMIVRTRMPLRLPLARHTLPFPTIIVPFASASSSFSSTAAFNPNATVAFDSDFSTITIDNPCGKASASAQHWLLLFTLLPAIAVVSEPAVAVTATPTESAASSPIWDMLDILSAPIGGDQAVSSASFSFSSASVPVSATALSASAFDNVPGASATACLAGLASASTSVTQIDEIDDIATVTTTMFLVVGPTSTETAVLSTPRVQAVSLRAIGQLSFAVFSSSPAVFSPTTSASSRSFTLVPGSGISSEASPSSSVVAEDAAASSSSSTASATSSAQGFQLTGKETRDVPARGVRS